MRRAKTSTTDVTQRVFDMIHTTKKYGICSIQCFLKTLKYGRHEIEYIMRSDTFDRLLESHGVRKVKFCGVIFFVHDVRPTFADIYIKTLVDSLLHVKQLATQSKGNMIAIEPVKLVRTAIRSSIYGKTDGRGTHTKLLKFMKCVFQDMCSYDVRSGRHICVVPKDLILKLSVDTVLKQIFYA